MVGKIVAALCLALPLATFAAGSDDSSSSSAQEEDSMWSRAKGLVDGGRFESALPVLFEVVGQEGERADAYNLLGFTHRKTGKLDAALKYYRKALELEPGHRGAHEYIGEAYLEMGDLASAKTHLKFLDNDCVFGCREYDMLKESIAKFEARN